MPVERFALIGALRRRDPAWIAKVLVVNLVLTAALFVPLGIFLGVRGQERVVETNDKLPWLRWYDDPASTIVISWETSENTSTYLAYGTGPGNLLMNATIAGTRTKHHVHLAGLSSNTRYYYRVGGAGDVHSFTTAPGPGDDDPFTFVAISDTQESYLGMNHHERVAAAIRREAVAGARFAIHGGDVVNYGGAQDSWNYFFKHAATYSPGLPFVFTLGNHDNMGSAQFYRQYYAFNQSNEPLYHSMNYSSSLHVASIPIPYGRPYELTTEMLDWLDDDLNRSSSIPFKVVVFHCPVLSSGFFGWNRQLVEQVHSILARHGVTLVINGHTHHYERLELDGITYAIVAGGGGFMDPCHNLLHETKAIHNIPHYARITVTPGTGLLFEAVTPDGIVFDSALLPGGGA